MSACYSVRGVMEATDEYKKKYAAFKACEDAGVDIPKELWEFFDGEYPDPSGMSVSIPCEKKTGLGSMTIEVDLAKLDPKVTKIQFIAGW